MRPAIQHNNCSPLVALRKRLLIVEDERVVALDLRGALEDLGYAVIGSAASSDAALEAIDRERPDLVLMDIRIDGSIDGIQTAGILRTRYQIPVVYLTAHVDDATLARALETEPAGYLVKPYNHDSLRTTIEVAFRRQAANLALLRAHHLEKARLAQRASEATVVAERLRRDATIDPLTGLYNRRHLDHVVEREISFGGREGHAVAIILLDLDRFKQLNDTFGHAAGDAALKAVAESIRSRLRVYDVACRYGGEEIVIVVPGAQIGAAMALAEQLRQGIENLVVNHRGVAIVRTTASFGVSAFPRHGVDPAELMHAADTALYRAKTEGRNRVIGAPIVDWSEPALQSHRKPPEGNMNA